MFGVLGLEPSLHLAEGDLFLDEVDDHQEVLSFLGMGTAVVVGDSDNGAVVLHDDGREGNNGDAQFLAEGDKVVEVSGESKDGAGLCLGRGRGDGGLFDATIVKCASKRWSIPCGPCCPDDE